MVRYAMAPPRFSPGKTKKYQKKLLFFELCKMTKTPTGKRTQRRTKTNTLFCVYREGFCSLFIEKRDTLYVV